MTLIQKHFLAILICFTVIVCSVIYAASHRYVNAGQGKILDKWTGTVSNGRK